MAAAHGLHDGIGIPVRKGPWVLETRHGLTLTQGAITQDALRRATGEVGRAYERVRAAVPERPVVHTDDTGWRVGGAPASLMACETDEVTVYQIRSQHRHEEVQEVMPTDYAGVMVTDRGRSYDAQAFDAVAQPKCLAHILRSISEVLQTKKGRSRDVGERLKGLLQDAIQLWHAGHTGEVAGFVTEAQRLRDALTHHLRPRLLSDPDNQRLLNGIGQQHDRGHVRRFVADPQVEPTNHRAERVLRPAVIARKVSQCSKNPAGAQAFAALKSVVQTLAKQGVGSMVEGLYHLFRSTRPHAASP
jgi:transposase